MACNFSEMSSVLKTNLIIDDDILNYASFTDAQILGLFEGFDSENYHIEIINDDLMGRDTLRLTVVDSNDPSIKLNSVVSFLPCPEECDPRYLSKFAEGKENTISLSATNPQRYCISDIQKVSSSNLTQRIAFHYNADFNKMACYPLRETSPGVYEGVFGMKTLNAWSK